MATYGDKSKFDVAPVASVDSEVAAVERENPTPPGQLGHAHDAGISQVHARPVAGQELLDAFSLILEIQPDSDPSRHQHLEDGAALSGEVRSIGEHRFAGPQGSLEVFECANGPRVRPAEDGSGNVTTARRPSRWPRAKGRRIGGGQS